MIELHPLVVFVSCGMGNANRQTSWLGLTWLFEFAISTMSDLFSTETHWGVDERLCKRAFTPDSISKFSWRHSPLMSLKCFEISCGFFRALAIEALNCCEFPWWNLFEILQHNSWMSLKTLTSSPHRECCWNWEFVMKLMERKTSPPHRANDLLH